MTTTLTYTGALTVTSCWCGIRVAIPDSLYREAHNNGHTVYCPLGHTFVFKTTEVDRLNGELEAERRRTILARSQRDRALTNAEAERRSAIAYKGHLTRVRNKIAAGVCPVPGCKRNFSNVRGHMERMHPDFHLTDPETGKVADL